MKIVAWIFGIILAVVVSLYMLVFTPFGNDLVRPFIESKVQEQTKMDSKLQTFRLSMSDFEILLEINPKNTVHIKGYYSLFSQKFNVAYRVRFEKLQTLKPLTQTQLNGALSTEGKVIGDMKRIDVDGVSDLAKSNTTYHVELTEFNPTSIIAKVDTLDLPALLYMLNQKQYARGKVDLDVNFKNITPHKLDGKVTLQTTKGLLNSTVMKKDFGITIPKTAFAMNLSALLKGDDVTYKYLLTSNLAKISSSGLVVPEPLKLDVKYGVDVKELAVLKPLTHADVRGALRLSGTAKGSKEKLIVQGKTDLASSNTTFQALLQNFQPKTLSAKIRGLKLQKVLYMVKQPHYTDGNFDMDLRLTSADVKNLQGTVDTKISRGQLDAHYLTKTYKFESPMPKTSYSVTTHTKLNKNLIDTKVDLTSSLANLFVKQARFNTKDGSLVSDYKAVVPNLDKLFFVSQRHLKGGITATGELKKAKDLDFSMHSDVAGGAVDATLHNDDFTADIKSMKTLDALDMLIYPKIFKADIDGKLNYNIVQQRGDFQGKLSEGMFTKNQVFSAVKQYAGIDMYIERFNGDTKADINKEHIVASLNLTSNNSAIRTQNAKLDTKRKTIDAKINIDANHNPVTVALRGAINSPKVSIDANKLIKREATKAVQKEIEKHLDKEVKKHLDKEVGKLLNGLF